MKEQQFIDIIKASLPLSSHYIGDDTAYIPEKDLILTQDTLIEDVHFRKATISPFDLGIKSIAVNLSDIAASGGVPAYILISLSLPEHIKEDFVRSFYEGVNYICEKYNVLVVGGDLTRASKITISVAVAGFSEGVKPAGRSNARVGDLVIVTGEFGSGRAGLWLLETGLNNPDLLKNIPESVVGKFIKKHVNPVPRLKEGRTIAETCIISPPALMDASDGLADALYKICLQSNAGMKIHFEDIPVDEDIKLIADVAGEDYQKWVLYGGEDYELVGTVTEDCFKELKRRQLKVKVIGKVIPSGERPAFYIDIDKNTMEVDSSVLDSQIFSHFGC